MPLNVNHSSGNSPQHICFCADGKYIRFILPAVESLVRTAKTHGNIHVHVIVDREPSTEFSDALERFLPGRNRIYVIDTDPFADLLEVTHISRGMYYRLMIPELIDARKVLYLDCDVLVRTDLGGLFATCLDGLLGAAVVNPFYDAGRLGLGSEDLYFNSGVLLINREEWLASRVKELVLTYLRENVNLLQMPDQDALNVVMKGRWKELNPSYNCQVSMLVEYKKLAIELAPRWTTEFINDPAIMHFSAGHKQWHSSNRIRYAKEYQQLESHVMEERRGKLADHLIGRLRQAKFSLLKSNPYFY